MKKIIAWALALALLCLTIPALAEDLTGDWYLVEIKSDSVSINPVDSGMSTVITLNPDGTAQLTTAYEGEEPEVETLAWTGTEAGVDLVFDDSSEEFTLEDGRLINESEGLVSVFGREAPQATDVPAFIAAETEDQFFGEWTLTKAFYMGMTFSAEEIGESKVVIAEGTLTEFSTAEGSDEAVEIQHPTVFANGNLTVLDDEGSTLLTVQLVEDGSLTVAAGEGELLMLMFFDRPAV